VEINYNGKGNENTDDLPHVKTVLLYRYPQKRWDTIGSYKAVLLGPFQLVETLT